MVMAIASAGGVLCFVAGTLYKQVGARMTTVIGSGLSGFSYVALAFLVRYQIHNVAPLVALIALCMHTTSHTVFNAMMTYTAEAFPPNRRGQVLGFLAAIYAMSAGVCGVLHSAFYPRVEDTENLLYCVAAFSAAPSVLALFMSPPQRLAREQLPLLPQRESNDMKLMTIAYAIAAVMVTDLQFGAYVAWTKPPPKKLAVLGRQVAIPMEVICLLFLVLLFGAFRLLPLSFRTTGKLVPPTSDTPPEDDDGDESGDVSVSDVPFGAVVRDFRFYLMMTTFFVLPGCGTGTALVRIREIAAARMLAPYQGGPVPVEVDAPASIGRAVRSAVVAFSACNLGSRLIMSTIVDRGGKGRAQREAWRLQLMTALLVLMGIAVLGVAFSESWGIIISIGAVGFAQGSFFALSPTMISFWFGIDGLLYYIPLAECGLVAATVLISSLLVSGVRNNVMENNFVDVWYRGSVNRYCAGFACFAPCLCLISALNIAVAVSYHLLRPRFVAASSRYGK